MMTAQRAWNGRLIAQLNKHWVVWVLLAGSGIIGIVGATDVARGNDPPAPDLAIDPEVAQLIATIENPSTSQNQRVGALNRIGFLRSRAKPAIPVLTRHFCSADPAAREMAAQSLALIGPEGIEAGVEAFVAAPAKPKEMYWALATLVRSDEMKAWRLVPLANHRDREIYEPVVVVLGGYDEVPLEYSQVLLQAMPNLIAAMKSSDLNTPTCAARLVGMLGIPARPAIPALASLLESRDPSARDAAASALYRLDIEQARALISQAQQRRAANAATRAATRPVTTRKALDPTVRVKVSAADRPITPRAGENIDRPSSGDEIQDLAAIVKDQRASVGERASAALRLGDLAAKAKPAIPVLAAQLQNINNQELFPGCLYALSRIGPEGLEAAVIALESRPLPQPSLSLLKGWGGVGPSAYPFLLRLAQRPNPAVRQHAIAALGAMSRELPAEHRPAVGQVLMAAQEVLLSKDSTYRRYAARLLGLMGTEARQCAPALQKLLEDGDPKVRQAVTTALAQMDLAVVEVAQTRRGVPPTMTKTIMPAVAATQPMTREEMEGWLAMLANPKSPPMDRQRAAAKLVHLGPQAKPLTPELVELFLSEDLFVRESAARILGQIDAESIQAALEAFRKAPPPPKQQFPLHVFGPKARPLLLKLLADPDPLVYERVVQALNDVNRLTPEEHPMVLEAMPRLLSMLQQPMFPTHRSAAAQLLGLLGPEAKPAFPILQRLLEDPDQPLRFQAATALERIDLTRGRPLADAARKQWAEADEKINGVDPMAAPYVKTLQLSSSFEGRKRALVELRKCGSRCRNAAQAVVPLLVLEELRLPATWALADMGDQATHDLRRHPLPGQERMEQALALADQTHLRDSSQPRAPAYSQMLDDPDIVPVQIALLSDPNPMLQKRAAIILQDLGLKALPALPALAEATANETRGNRQAAVSALWNIIKPLTNPYDKNPVASDPAVRVRATPLLIQVLRNKDADSSCRQAAMMALNNGPKSAEVAQAMAEVLSQSGFEQSYAFFRDLAAKNDPLVEAAILPLIKSASPQDRQLAERLLSAASRPEKLILPLSKDTDWESRQRAAELAKNHPDIDAAATSVVLHLLSDPEPRVRVAAAEAMPKMAINGSLKTAWRDDPQAKSALLSAARDLNPATRTPLLKAIRTLDRDIPVPIDAQPELAAESANWSTLQIWGTSLCLLLGIAAAIMEIWMVRRWKPVRRGAIASPAAAPRPAIGAVAVSVPSGPQPRVQPPPLPRRVLPASPPSLPPSPGPGRRPSPRP